MLTQLEMTEFIAEDWLEPGMFMGDGVMERCFTTWLTFLTVSKTLFWCLGRDRHSHHTLHTPQQLPQDPPGHSSTNHLVLSSCTYGP